MKFNPLYWNVKRCPVCEGDGWTMMGDYWGGAPWQAGCTYCCGEGRITLMRVLVEWLDRRVK